MHYILHDYLLLYLYYSYYTYKRINVILRPPRWLEFFWPFEIISFASANPAKSVNLTSRMCK